MIPQHLFALHTGVFAIFLMSAYGCLVLAVDKWQLQWEKEQLQNELKRKKSTDWIWNDKGRHL